MTERVNNLAHNNAKIAEHEKASLLAKTSAHDEYESNNPFGVNKYNTLVIEDSLINDDPVNELNKKRNQRKRQRKVEPEEIKESKELKNQNQNARDRPTTDNGGSTSQNNITIIVGDSMLKMLNVGRMSCDKDISWCQNK